MSSDSLIHAAAGSLGGIVAITATYPLVFLSTRAAVETKKEQKSTVQAVLDIVKREGVAGLYSGLGSSMLGIAVTNGIYYFFYERSRAAILHTRSGGKGLTTPESILIGLVAGSATTIISNPIWVVQTSQAIHTMTTSDLPSASTSASTSSSASETPKVVKRPSIPETIRLILEKDGVQGFWRGIGPALVLVINPVIQYTVFEQLKNLLIKRRLAKAGKAGAAAALVSDWDFFFLGALSKLVATSSTYPYIVVKSRLQAASASAQRYKSAIDGLLIILREEGIEGLYKGVGGKLLQSVLTAAILFAGQRRFYEMTKAALSTVAV